MAFCSAVTLCFASIFSLAAAALLAIAFSTDNWQTISVNKQYNAAEVAPENVAKDLVSDYNIKASNSLTAYLTNSPSTDINEFFQRYEEFNLIVVDIFNADLLM